MKPVKMSVILGCLFTIPLVQAASFDCSKAQTKVETLICTFPQLSKADEELGQLYTQALKSLPTSPAAQLREEQRAWLEQRDQQLTTACIEKDCPANKQESTACFNANCAVAFYSERISVLKGDAKSTASFDCTKASTPAEKMICTHSQLSSQDKRLNKVYKELQETSTAEKAKTLQEEQRAWLKTRDTELINCGQNMDCAVAVYEDRISALSQTDPYDYEDTSTIVGHYHIAEYMTLQVKSLARDHVLIDIEGAEPTEGKWLCHFSGVGTLIEDTVTVCHPEKNTPILFTFSENTVKVDGEHLNYFCGRGMTVAGQYQKDH